MSTTARAGVMIRDGTATGSNFLALAGTTTSGGYKLITRTTVNGQSNETDTSPGQVYTYPNTWLELVRAGNTLHAFVSSNDSGYYEVTPTAGIAWTGISSTLNVGLFSDSGSSSADAVGVFSNYNLTSIPTGPLGYLYAVGENGSYNFTQPVNVAYGAIVNGTPYFYYEYNVTGTINFNNTTFGDPIVGTFKAGFYQVATGPVATGKGLADGAIDPNWTIKASPNGASSAYVVPAGYPFPYWFADNSTSEWIAPTAASGASEPPGVYTYQTSFYLAANSSLTLTLAGDDTISAVRLNGTPITVPSGTGYTGFTTVTIPSSVIGAGGNEILQIDVTNNGTSNNPTGFRAEISVSGADPDIDIGAPGKAGTASVNGITYVVSGGGADIWGNSDQFNYDYIPTTGITNTLIAKVTSITNTNTWAKAGVMFRDSTAAGAIFVDMVATQGQGVSFQWRSTTSGSCGDTQTASIGAPSSTNPVWVKLVKNGTTYTGYYSLNGSTWTQVGAKSVTLTNSNYLAGLAVTAHNNAALNTATFTNVTW